jgi:hypothetical protein
MVMGMERRVVTSRGSRIAVRSVATAPTALAATIRSNTTATLRAQSKHSFDLLLSIAGDYTHSHHCRLPDSNISVLAHSPQGDRGNRHGPSGWASTNPSRRLVLRHYQFPSSPGLFLRPVHSSMFHGHGLCLIPPMSLCAEDFQPAKRAPRRKALVIGISYVDATSSWESISGQHDADNFYNYLISAHFASTLSDVWSSLTARQLIVGGRLIALFS